MVFSGKSSGIFKYVLSTGDQQQNAATMVELIVQGQHKMVSIGFYGSQLISFLFGHRKLFAVIFCYH